MVNFQLPIVSCRGNYKYGSEMKVEMKIFQKNLDVLGVSTAVENVTRMEGSGFLRESLPEDISVTYIKVEI